MTLADPKKVSNALVEAFWEDNPVAASAIPYEPGTLEYFRRFDAIRERDDCEPWGYSNRIHGYTDAKGKRVLDVGCGNGYVLKQYANHGAEAHGIDITINAVHLSRKRFEQDGLNGTFRQTDGDIIPYPDAHFDIVCSMGVLHHIEDPRPIISEIERVLKPGGQVIIMLYYQYSWKHQVVHRLKKWFHPAYRGCTLQEVLNRNDGENCPLALVYDKPEAEELFSAFKDIHMELNQLSWRQLFLLPRPLANLVDKLLPSCSESWFARKMGWNLYLTGRRK